MKELNTKIDGHFIQEKLLTKEIYIKFVASNDQLSNVLKKSLRGPRIEFMCFKIGTYNLYTPS